MVGDWVRNPGKYKGQKISELTDDEDIDEQTNVVHGEAYHKRTVLPKMTLVRNIVLFAIFHKTLTKVQ